VPSVGTTTFRYDPFGSRIQKSGPLGTTNYLYDGFQLIEEADQGGTVLARYTMDQGIDEPVAQFRSGTGVYYQRDVLNSVTSLSNSASALVNTYNYDSFGKLIALTGTLTNQLLYTGREADSETGLLFDRARYLDPYLGRFLSEDPMGVDGGLTSTITFPTIQLIMSIPLAGRPAQLG
jgi:RHS repeat-associated protein